MVLFEETICNFIFRSSYGKNRMAVPKRNAMMTFENVSQPSKKRKFKQMEVIIVARHIDQTRCAGRSANMVSLYCSLIQQEAD